MLLNCHVGLDKQRALCTLSGLMNWDNETREGVPCIAGRLALQVSDACTLWERSQSIPLSAAVQGPSPGIPKVPFDLQAEDPDVKGSPGAWPCQSQSGCGVAWGGRRHCWIPDTERAELPVVFNTFVRVCFLLRATSMRSPGQGSPWPTLKGWPQGRLNNSSGTLKSCWH